MMVIKKMKKIMKSKIMYLLLLIVVIHQCLFARDNIIIDQQREDFEIPLTEDLMREHGLLNRVLLIYEEIIKRIENNISFEVDIFADAVNIMKSFIEDYHEKLEEDYIFPLFEKAKKERNLVKTLKRQHDKGREITAQLQKIVMVDKPLHRKDKRHIKKLLQKFIKMYRPHEAREDTVLFPQIRSLIDEQEFKKLGELFEDREHKLFGEHGFEKMVKQVETIEKQLTIYNLEQFTPRD